MTSASLNSWTCEVEKCVRRLGRAKKPPGGAAYVGTNLEFLNARMPDLRRLARDLHQNLPEDWRLCAQALWDTKIFELRNLAIELAVCRKKSFIKSDWRFFRRWLDDSVGWAMIDHLTCDPFADLLDIYPSLSAKTRVWSKSRNVWLRRASLAVFCRPALKGHFVDISFENLTRLAADHDPMVLKAVSWLLRNFIKTNRCQVGSFLHDHEAVLAKQVLREVRTKLLTGKKNPKR
jgi:3-methyladenine DNA glycosylase AlkD